MLLRRVLIAVAIIVLVPVVLLAAALVVVQSAWAERWIERRASDALHREVQVATIRLHLGWPPTVSFGRLRIANPPWASAGDLIDARDLAAKVAVPPLFAGRILIPYVEARSAVAGLEMKNDRASWRFGNESANQPSRIVIGLVKIADGKIRFLWPEQKTDLAIVMKGSLGEGGELDATASGKFRGDEAKASARFPALDPQHAAAGPIEFSGDASAGRTHVSAQGMFRTQGDVMDLRMKLSGATLKDLNHLLQIVLPDTAPYSLDGHLIHNGNDWTFDGFQGRVGNSDLHGSLTYRTGGQRPFLRANLHSALLDFQDLGPLIGAPPGNKPGKVANAEQREKSARREAANQILPHAEFSVERWNVMDADVRLESKRIARPHALAVESLDTHILLKDGALRLDPLDFGYAGGHIRSVVAIDGRKRPVQGHLQADVQGLQLAKLLPADDAGDSASDGGKDAGTAKPKASKAGVKNDVKQALGTLYGRAKLDGTGRSVAELLGTSNGHITLAVDGGQVSRLLEELLKLHLADALRLLGTRNDQVELNCAVGGLEVKDGVIDPKAFVVDTSDSRVQLTGDVSLREETLGLTVHPTPKDATLFSLRTPIDLKGPLRHPKIHLHPGPIAARVAGAIALGAINPALAILPFVDDGPAKDTNCGQLLAEARAQGAQRKQ
ncbi:MAG TPA: AsmA family protein [Usitatibacter sp.]|nr:AsmA family protein [Usitatibacter sp.]